MYPYSWPKGVTPEEHAKVVAEVRSFLDRTDKPCATWVVHYAVRDRLPLDLRQRLNLDEQNAMIEEALDECGAEKKWVKAVRRPRSTP